MRLLKWNLDFKNSELGKEYDAEFNATSVRLTRVALLILVLALPTVPVFEYVIEGTPMILIKLYSILLGAFWCALWIPLFFTKPVKRNATIISAIVFACLGLLSNILNVLVPENYLNDKPGYIVSVLILAQPLALRTKCKHFAPLNLVNTLFHIVVTVLLLHESISARIAYCVPNMVCNILALYCGYFFEMRWKYDFVRRKLADAEATKLAYVVARDASLLRNIFPKNLSDQLEQQLADRRTSKRKSRRSRNRSRAPGAKPSTSSTTRSTRSTRSTKSTAPKKSFVPIPSYDPPVNEAPVPEPPSNPVVRAVSQFAAKANNWIVRSISTKQPNQWEVSSSTDPSPREESLQLEPVYTWRGPTGPSPFSANPVIHTKNTARQHSTSLSLSVSIPTHEAEYSNSSYRQDSDFNNSNRPEHGSQDYSKRDHQSDWIESKPQTPKRTSSFIALPPVVTTPEKPPSDAVDFVLPSRIISRKMITANGAQLLTSRGTPLHTPHHKPEFQTFFSGTQHTDGTAISLSHSYPNVTVIFADIVGFTSLSSCISPQELVKLLNSLFSRFDDIVDKFQLEKIRTVGDAYLCVGNMSIPLQSPEVEAVNAALEMIEEVRKVNPALGLRVGISSGPLIAGVTGITKWNYDIFGKPLALANHMESVARPNCIAVTDTFYNLCKDIFKFQIRVRKSDDNSHEEYYFEMEGDNAQKTSRGVVIDSSSLSTIDDQFALLAPTPKEVGIEAMGLSLKQAFELNSEPNLETGDSLPVDDINLTQFDISRRFGYTREELDVEERLLLKTKVSFSFLNNNFEAEYRTKAVQAVHKYTFYLSLLFATLPIVCLLMDLGIYKIPHVQMSIIFAYLIGAGVILTYAVFVKFFDFSLVGNLVSVIPTLTFSLLLLYITYKVPTVMHITDSIISVLATGTFIRIPLMLMTVSQTVASIFVAVIVQQYMPDLNHGVAFIMLSFSFTIISFLSQAKIQKSLRQQFLSQKRVEFDIFHQKVAQHRAAMLLRNILPAEIIPRLKPAKTGERVGVVDHFDEATIMFVNITNLEELTAELNPACTFQIYNDLFTLFDEATHSFGLEKIKTINTVYMVASGLPKKIPNHVEMAIKLAVEIYRIATQYANPLITINCEVRIGIATGPVVSGIIGKKKYTYDCWSDTVNTAARMESSGSNGYLQATDLAFAQAENKALFKKRGNVRMKGKGVMDTYIVPLSILAQ